MLITLSGVDCAGKSTQIELLEDAARARGLSVATFWYRPGYSAELDAVRAAVRRISPTTLPEAGRSEARAKAFSKAGVSQTWIAMALVDSLLQYGLKLRALMAIHDVVMCDRYMDDAALDFTMRFPDADVGHSPWFELVSRLVPEPDMRLLLMLPYESMLRRMENKQEPFPDPPDVRAQRFEAYQVLAQTDRFYQVDASKPIQQVHRDILNVLEFRAPSTRQ